MLINQMENSGKTLFLFNFSEKLFLTFEITAEQEINEIQPTFQENS